LRNLLHLQDEFAEALLSATSPVPPCVTGAAVRRADRRFAVYRNNVTTSLIEALGSRFPVVKRLVGDAFFRALAQAYILREPPLSPLLIYYGETFPRFIEEFEAAKPLPYLADVARLEFARGRAYHAADAAPLPRQAFADLPEERIGVTRVMLHPSVGIVASAYPLLSIWQANQAAEVAPVETWGGECVLIARPYLEVQTLRLGAGIDVFLRALQSGASIAGASEAACAAAPCFDAAEGLATLIGQNLAVALSA
jgi:hypothetical protein